MSSEWTIGIVTGIISSAIIFFFSLLINKLVAPKIHGFFQRIPNISGTWEFYDSDADDARPVGHVEVTQQGSNINAKIVRNLSRDGAPSQRVFNCSGKFHSAQLAMIFEDVKAPGFIIGAGVCQLSSKADAFAGKTVYIDHSTGKAVAYDVFFRR